jgi:hypothetical protein
MNAQAQLTISRSVHAAVIAAMVSLKIVTPTSLKRTSSTLRVRSHWGLSSQRRISREKAATSNVVCRVNVLSPGNTAFWFWLKHGWGRAHPARIANRLPIR